jgi:choline kinase
MRGIILAAGGGTRLRPLTEHQPKCLVSVNGVPIIQNALCALLGVGCSDVSIVIGYRQEVIKQRVGSKYYGMQVHYVCNSDWESTNSMFSLHLALEDALPHYIIEGDVYFDPEILRHSAPSDVGWMVDSVHRISDGAYVQRDKDGYVSNLQIVRNPAELGPQWAKSIGILVLSDRGALRLREWLRTAVSQAKRDLYYDLIIAEHLKERTVQAVDIAPAKWWEIDTPEDLATAERLFS